MLDTGGITQRDQCSEEICHHTVDEDSKDTVMGPNNRSNHLSVREYILARVRSGLEG